MRNAYYNYLHLSLLSLLGVNPIKIIENKIVVLRIV